MKVPLNIPDPLDDKSVHTDTFENDGGTLYVPSKFT